MRQHTNARTHELYLSLLDQNSYEINHAERHSPKDSIPALPPRTLLWRRQRIGDPRLPSLTVARCGNSC